MEIYKTLKNHLEKIDIIQDGAWINLVSPTDKEVVDLSKTLKIEKESLMAALDTEERPRIEVEDNEILIIVDVPYIEKNKTTNSGVSYTTLPLGIIVTKENIITVSSASLSLIEIFKSGIVKGALSNNIISFVLQLLHRNSTNFLIYLRNIEKQSKERERELYQSMRNRELLGLLELEKSLVYFSTSLKTNESVLERMGRMAFIKENLDDAEFLEEVIIENKQAIEMAKIYSDVLSVVMEVFASVISNNFNMLMKRLTAITIVMAVPNILSGLWGMNVAVPFGEHSIGFPIILGIISLISIMTALLLHRKQLL